MRARRGGGLAATACVIAALLAGCGGGSSAPPSDGATRLVPANALVYVHLSTDTSREGVKRAQKLARSFPSYARLRDSLLRRLSAPGCGVSGSFKGKDAALALLPGNAGTAGSLVLVDTGAEHRASRERTCGLVSARYVGRYLAIGQPATLRDAVALAAGKGRSLAADPLYRQASKGLPDDRVIDAFASAVGVRDLLAPQAGLLGAVGALLDRPGLRGVAASLSADDPGAKIVLHTITNGPGTGPTHPGFRPFEPSFQSAIPKSAFAYLGVSDVGGAAKRLLGALSAGSGGGGTAGALAGLLQRAKAQLDREAGGRLTRDVLSLFKGEVAVALTPAVPAPVLTILAHTRSDAATSSALAALRAPLARLLTAPGATAPRWRAQTIAGAQAYVLRLAPGVQIAYAVFGGKLVIATQPSGIAAVRRASGGGIGATAEYKQVVGAPDGRVTSVLFLDFHQLLRLGEETGLGASAAYQSFKGDLEKVRAVGAHSSGAGDESTAEILLSIP